MKSIRQNIFLLLSASLFASGCSKDKGNYDYADINVVEFAGLKTQTDPYQVFFGDTLHIIPQLTYTLDKSPDTSKYVFEWTMATVGTAKPPVVANSRELHLPARQTPGDYELIYRVKDKATGVQYQTKTYARIISEVYEGYLVLSDVNGVARLDMLTYTNAGFSLIKDVLAKMKSSLPAQGQPYQIVAVPSSVRTYDIWLLTATATTRLEPESFDVTATSDIRYFMLGDIPAGFKAESMVASYGTNKASSLWVKSGDNIYCSRMSLSFGLPINVYATNGQSFKPANTWTTMESYASIYDQSQKKFATQDAGYSSCDAVDASFNYPAGYDFVYMGKQPTVTTGVADLAFAIIKNPATQNYHVIRYTVRNRLSFTDTIENAPDIDKATQFAISPEFGYLFYSVGGKVYEYDLGLETAKLMLDKGTEIITSLKFQEFATLKTAAKASYSEWGKLLSVASYDPGGTAGNNGSLTLYKVPPVNGNLIEQQKWTGFGKIVSFTYRER